MSNNLALMVRQSYPRLDWLGNFITEYGPDNYAVARTHQSGINDYGRL